MKILLPLLLMAVGVGGGVGAGLFLFPPPAPEDPAPDEAGCVPTGPEAAPAALPPVEEPRVAAADREYVRLANQFVVPVVTDGRVVALVVLSLSVEVEPGQQDAVFAQEPKLRDVFLQVLFDHANAGGFEGVFTSSANMRSLRTALRSVAREVVGPRATDVLIVDLVRQDVQS